MSEARADGAEIDRAGPRRLRPKHLAKLVAIAVAIGILGLSAWRVARGEARGGFVAAIRAGERLIAPTSRFPSAEQHSIRSEPSRKTTSKSASAPR